MKKGKLPRSLFKLDVISSSSLDSEGRTCRKNLEVLGTQQMHIPIQSSTTLNHVSGHFAIGCLRKWKLARQNYHRHRSVAFIGPKLGSVVDAERGTYASSVKSPSALFVTHHMLTK